jgi:hypothetical protein
MVEGGGGALGSQSNAKMVRSDALNWIRVLSK